MTEKQMSRMNKFLNEQAIKMTSDETIRWLKANNYPQPEKTYWQWRAEYVSSFKDIPILERIKENATPQIPQKKVKRIAVRLTNDTKVKIMDMYLSGMTIVQVAKQLDIPYATAGRIVTLSGKGRKPKGVKR